MNRYSWRHLGLPVIAALALLLVGQFAAQGVAHPADANEVSFQMSWRYHPQTFQEGRDRAELIVLANVTAVNRGPDFVGVHPEEPGGETRSPTQRITLKVVKVYRGNAVPGQTLTLTQDGGTTDRGPGSQVARFAEDNPRYQQGERYVLLLQPSATAGLHRIIAPEGRYRIGSGDIVIPVIDHDNAVVRGLRDKPLAYLEQLLTAP